MYLYQVGVLWFFADKNKRLFPKIEHRLEKIALFSNKIFVFLHKRKNVKNSKLAVLSKIGYECIGKNIVLKNLASLFICRQNFSAIIFPSLFPKKILYGFIPLIFYTFLTNIDLVFLILTP